MTLKTRTKFTSQLQSIQEHVVRLKEKCAADVRAAGLAATGDRGAQEGVVEGRKAEDRLRESIEDGCLDAMLLQQPLIGDDLRYENGHLVTDYTKRAGTDQSIRGLKKMEEEDPERARNLSDEIIKNTYRTLMTRGMKGCYVYATDPGLRQYLKKRSEKAYHYHVVQL